MLVTHAASSGKNRSSNSVYTSSELPSLPEAVTREMNFDKASIVVRGLKKNRNIWPRLDNFEFIG